MNALEEVKSDWKISEKEPRGLFTVAPQTESEYKRFFWLMMAGMTTAVIGGVGSFITIVVAVRVQGDQLERFDSRFEKIEAKLDSVTTTRYTAQDASRDREGVMSMISGTVQRIDRIERAIDAMRDMVLTPKPK